MSWCADKSFLLSVCFRCTVKNSKQQWNRQQCSFILFISVFLMLATRRYEDQLLVWHRCRVLTSLIRCWDCWQWEHLFWRNFSAFNIKKRNNTDSSQNAARQIVSVQKRCAKRLGLQGHIQLTSVLPLYILQLFDGHSLVKEVDFHQAEAFRRYCSLVPTCVQHQWWLTFCTFSHNFFQFFPNIIPELVRSLLIFFELISEHSNKDVAQIWGCTTVCTNPHCGIASVHNKIRATFNYMLKTLLKTNIWERQRST